MDGRYKNLISDKQVDFGRRSDDYARHRPGFPDAFFQRLVAIAARVGALEACVGNPFITYQHDHDESKNDETEKTTALSLSKVRVLDIGTGPGIVALRLAELLPNATIVGVDIAAPQIAAARRRAKDLGLDDRCSFSVATAEQTGQDADSFDIIVAGQCWPWFDHSKAMPEIQRVLKPNKSVLIIGQFCYQPRMSPAAADTEALVLKYNPKWAMADGDGLYPQQVDQLVIQGGFRLVEQFTFDHAQPFSHEGWRGRMRTCNGVGSGVLTEEQVAQWDDDLAAMLKAKYAKEPLFIWHRVWGLAVSLPPHS